MLNKLTTVEMLSATDVCESGAVLFCQSYHRVFAMPGHYNLIHARCCYYYYYFLLKVLHTEDKKQYGEIPPCKNRTKVHTDIAKINK